MIRLEITDPTTAEILVPHLSASFSFEMVRENPLFNRRGDYTYDIDISMRDPYNRAIYKHVNRLTATSKPLNRRARLLADGHVIADGTEVILRLEADTLKIQIVAGNSELNYLTADDSLRIRDMDFGFIPSLTNELAAETSMKVFPAANYVFPKSIRDLGALPREREVMEPQEHEELLRKVYLNLCEYSTSTHRMEYEEGTDLRGMPYVLYLVERFVQQMGYTIENNELREERRWCRLIMAHGYDTLDIAKMLPNWTAAEFLKEVETFFNCVFLVNPVSRGVIIKKYQNFIKENNPIVIEKIVDDFERDYEAENAEFMHEYEGVEYELPDGDYWKRMSLDPSVEKLCTRITATLEAVGAKRGEGMPVEQTYWKIFKLPDKDVEFVKINSYVEGTTYPAGNEVYKRYFVNQFKPYGEGEKKTLKIIPVRTEYIPGSPVRICPVTEEVEKKENVIFSEAIGKKITENTVENMQVCFYTPDGNAFGVNYDRTIYRTNFRTPICVTAQDYLEDRVYGVPVHVPDYTGLEELTLELNGEHGLYNTHFVKNMAINMNEANKIRFRCSTLLDTTMQFIIHGRLFVCQQLRYTYGDGRQHPIVEGTFFPYL